VLGLIWGMAAAGTDPTPQCRRRGLALVDCLYCDGWLVVIAAGAGYLQVPLMGLHG